MILESWQEADLIKELVRLFCVSCCCYICCCVGGGGGVDQKFGGICPCSGLLSVTQTGRVSYGKASPGYARIYDNFSRRAGCNCGASLCHAEVF